MGNVNAKVTDDTIDFIIDSYNQGFCFGVQRDGSFYIWQVNAEHSGRVSLRPHIKQSGDRTVTPVKGVDATDITAAVGDYTKPVHERIEVMGRTVKTYFGANEKELKLVRHRMRRSIGFSATFDGAGSIQTIYPFPATVLSARKGSAGRRIHKCSRKRDCISAIIKIPCHYAYGAVGGWMFSSMAGIGYDSEHAGFKHIIFAPHPDMRIQSAEAVSGTFRFERA